MFESTTKAIENAGGIAAAAKALGLTAPAVRAWVVAGRIPPARVIPVERISGVSRHDLRPDIYPREDAHEAAE
jgi:DNA-binding transcriptional regulator YdaS (Cro superfamily)